MALLKLMTEKLRELEIYKEEKQLYKINSSISVAVPRFFYSHKYKKGRTTSPALSIKNY